MRLTRSHWLAAVSAFLLLATALHAARRPRYGGELRIELRTALPVESFYETLVQIDERGDPQPCLATSWAHDTAHKHWTFTPRANVMLHDGSIWTPAAEALSVPDDKPIDQILRELANPKNAIPGTGPFRIARLDPGKSMRLEAHEGYWRGRPFLDAVEVRMGRGLRDQALDLELAKTDVAEAEVTDIRRLRQQGVNLEISKPLEVIALVFDNIQVPAAARQALALAIDREAIQRVLLDRQGEISGALVPQWLSGYAFLFPSARDLARAKALHPAFPLSFAYDHGDPLIRSIAERISVNANEAGITLHPSTGAGSVRLTRLEGAGDFAAVSSYEGERAFLEDFRVIPLFHLPKVHALAPKVRGWGRLEDVWLDSE
jgi:peptide/nickel transport system substrate-binding protein